MTRKIWETRDEYWTLDELCQFSYHTSLGDSAYTGVGVFPPYNGFEALKEWATLRDITKRKLADIGFSRFSYVGNGDFAVVLKTVDDQVVRISVDDQENKRLWHPAIWQPRVAYLLNDETNKDAPVIRLEVLTQIKDGAFKIGGVITTNGVEPGHVQILKAALYTSALDPYDLDKKNVGLMSDGTPVVIDGGAVAIMNDQEIIIDEQRLSRWLTTNNKGNTIWKQFALYPEISEGRITGGVTTENIEFLGNYLGKDSQVYRAALEDGLYRSELGQLIVNASMTYEEAASTGKHVDWREALGLERTKLNRRGGPGVDWPKL